MVQIVAQSFPKFSLARKRKPVVTLTHHAKKYRGATQQDHKLFFENWDVVPQELICKIFEYLSLSFNLQTCALVCKEWYHLCNTHYPLWRRVCFPAVNQLSWGKTDYLYAQNRKCTETMFNRIVSYLVDRPILCQHMEVVDISKFRIFSRKVLGIQGDLTNKLIPLLKNLKTIKFYRHTLTDDTIEQMSKYCKKLETLDLSGCRTLSHTSLVSLAKSCNKISTLNVKWCGSYSSDVTEFTFCEMARHLPNLKYINFSGAKLSDEGLTLLCKICTSLRRLNISNNMNITSIGIRAMAENLVHLEELTARHTSATLQWFEAFEASNCTNLKALDFSLCEQLDGELIIPDTLSNLEYLSLEQCCRVTSVKFLNNEKLKVLKLHDYFTMKDQDNLSRLPNLEEFHHSTSSPVLVINHDDFMNFVQNSFPKLQKITLQNSTLRGSSVLVVPPTITSLNISNMFNLVDPVLNIINGKNLTYLNISGYQFRSPDTALKSCKNLKELFLDRNTKATEITLDFPALQKLSIIQCINMKRLYFKRPLLDLKSIGMKFCHSLEVRTLRDLFEFCPNIEMLNVKYCPWICTSALEILHPEMKMRETKILKLNGCVKIDNYLLPLVIERFPNVEELAIGGGKRNVPSFLDNKGLMNICRMPFLKKIFIVNCPNISNKGLSYLVQHKKENILPLLHTIHLLGCGKTTKEGVQLLITKANYTINIIREHKKQKRFFTS